ncbi:hypothetical protein PAMP_006720 [Pampus punctatissimus]
MKKSLKQEQQEGKVSFRVSLHQQRSGCLQGQKHGCEPRQEQTGPADRLPGRHRRSLRHRLASSPPARSHIRSSISCGDSRRAVSCVGLKAVVMTSRRDESAVSSCIQAGRLMLTRLFNRVDVRIQGRSQRAAPESRWRRSGMLSALWPPIGRRLLSYDPLTPSSCFRKPLPAKSPPPGRQGKKMVV